MNFEMQKANLLAENINGFINYVQKYYKSKNSLFENPDKLYQIILLMKEYRFQIIADELIRINRFTWDEKYTHLLVDRFKKGISVIDEYVKNQEHDLFVLTARLYTLKNLSSCFTKSTKDPNHDTADQTSSFVSINPGALR